MANRILFAGLAIVSLFGCARNDALLDVTFEPVAGEPGVNALGGLPAEFPPGGPLDRLVVQDGAGPVSVAHAVVVDRPVLSARPLTPEEEILRERVDRQAFRLDGRPAESEVVAEFQSAERPLFGSPVPYRLSWNGWGPTRSGPDVVISIKNEAAFEVLQLTLAGDTVILRSNAGQTVTERVTRLRRAHAFSIVFHPNEAGASGGQVEVEIWRSGASSAKVVPLVAFYREDVRSTRFLDGVVVEITPLGGADYTVDQMRFRPASLPIEIVDGSL